ncbi:MAG: CRISPR-associated endonuclease Cas2, partial [Christensenellaceae bacterium]|nr:CRISPR-associated endonuclease Cas2 [Christensenellaceae bacterium]
MEDFNIDSKGVNDPFSFDTGDVNEKKDKKYFVLIIYDISDNKRRYQMVKALLSFGFRVQKSAFEAMLKPAKYKKLIEKIKD